MPMEQAASPHVKTSSLSLSVQIKVELRSSAFTAAASAIIDRRRHSESGSHFIWESPTAPTPTKQAPILFCHLDKLPQCRNLTGEPPKVARHCIWGCKTCFHWPSVELNVEMPRIQLPNYSSELSVFSTSEVTPNRNVWRERPLCLSLSDLEPRKIGWLF